MNTLYGIMNTTTEFIIAKDYNLFKLSKMIDSDNILMLWDRDYKAWVPMTANTIEE